MDMHDHELICMCMASYTQLYVAVTTMCIVITYKHFLQGLQSVQTFG